MYQINEETRDENYHYPSITYEDVDCLPNMGDVVRSQERFA